MNWTAILIAVVIIAAFLMISKGGQISAEDAAGYLKDDALVIDVRSPGEFNSGHLPAAINIPLDTIDTALPRRVKDKNQIVLLHCLSGARSGMAKDKMKSLGYVYITLDMEGFRSGSMNEVLKRRRTKK